MNRRPLPVAIICVLGAIAALVTSVLFAVDTLWAVPPTAGQRAVVFAAMAATVAGLHGMWRMRRWGVALIAVLFALRIAYGMVTHLPWNLPALAGPTAILLVGLIYLHRMS
jgi:hypothetical protein